MAAGGPLAGPRRAVALAVALTAAVVLAVVISLALTGSGPFRNGPSAQAEPVPSTPGVDGPGVYTLKTRHGASIRFEIPAPSPPDEDVEGLRGDLHVRPVTYVEVEIDNTEGTRPVEVRELTVKGPHEGLYPFHPAQEALVDWGPARADDGGYVLVDGTEIGADQGSTLAGRARAAMKRYADPVPVGEEGRRLMIGDFERLPDVFAELLVSPHAGEPPQTVQQSEAGPEQSRSPLPDSSSPAPAPPGDAVPRPLPPAPTAPVQPTVEPLPPAEPQPPVVPPVDPEPTPGPVPPVDPQPTPGPVLPVDPRPTPDPVLPVDPQPTPGPVLPVDPQPTPGPVLPVDPQSTSGPPTTASPEGLVPASPVSALPSAAAAA